MAQGDWVIPIPYLLASVGIEEEVVLVIIAWHTYLAALQTMQVDENRSQVNIKCMIMIEQKNKHIIRLGCRNSWLTWCGDAPRYSEGG